jgi:hypothetical protein
MSFVQRLFTAILPRGMVESMEKESRSWMARCSTCGLSRSIWDLGGIRWGAAGNPRRRLHCLKCNAMAWHVIEQKQT